jgi:hypothetical protein
MMSDKDLKEYEDNIKLVSRLKKSNKYNYLQGKQITDEESGSRVYDFNGSRLPSVTTILGKTKNQQFLKDWKAKVGEQEAERIKNLSSKRGLVCTNSLNLISKELATMILQGSDKRRSPWPKKLLKWVLRLWKNIMDVKLHYIILAFMLGALTSYVYITVLKLL